MVADGLEDVRYNSRSKASSLRSKSRRRADLRRTELIGEPPSLNRGGASSFAAGRAAVRADVLPMAPARKKNGRAGAP
jgi:hypothetical protein